MSYIVHQHIRGKTYAYEVEGYWDSEKKQARQKRKYLGAVDEATGEIRKKEAERDVVFAKTYGPSYLLMEVGGTLQLREKLQRAFGEDADKLLALAVAKVINPTSLRNVQHLLEDSYLPEMLELREELSSQRLSDFLRKLGKRELEFSRFCSSLVREDEEALVYDITSLSSYSRQLGWLEYGKDYRESGLPQTNLGLVMSLDRKLPIYQKLFPGSVNDVSTLSNLVAEVKNLGVKDCLFVLDRGFYSESNLMEMLNEGVDFIMPLPFSTKSGKGSISETNLEIDSPENARRFGSEVLYVLEKEIELAGTSLDAFVFYSIKRQADEEQSFLSRLMDIEAKLEGKRVYGNALDHFERVAYGMANFFEARVEDHILHLERRPKAISQHLNRAGKVILLSSRNMAWDEVLALYRERDVVEKLYDDLKNDLDILPLRVHSYESLRGLLVVYFVAMLLRSLLLQAVRKGGLLERRSIEELLLDMAKLRAVQVGGKRRLTEVTKSQRTTFEKVGVRVPVAP